MKKAIKIILPSAIIIGIILYSLFINGIFVTDYSARLGESNRLIWQGRTYWGTSYKGYEVGRIKGKRAITTHIPNHTYYEDGEINTKRHTVECYIIPEKYYVVLEKSGKGVIL